MQNALGFAGIPQAHRYIFFLALILRLVSDVFMFPFFRVMMVAVGILVLSDSFTVSRAFSIVFRRVCVAFRRRSGIHELNGLVQFDIVF